MNTILKIAWRNIWRNQARSLVVIVAIIVGIWSVIFLSGFSIGMGKSFIDNSIQNETSHMQVHHPDFKDDKEVQYTLKEPKATLTAIQSAPEVKAATLRTVVSGMVSSSRGVRGVEIRGIEPALEAEVTQLPSKLIDGEYLNPDRKTGILISVALAEKLKIKLRKKITLRFQDGDNNLIDGAFRVAGLFETKNKAFDEGIVFVQRQQLNKLLQMPDAAHEAAVLLSDLEQLQLAEQAIKAKLPNQLVENYKEIAPEIELFYTQIQLSSSIFTFIVMLGLIFGIINTMLMAVLERIRELGMLMSIGMNKTRVFGMIVFETLMLGLISTPIGLLLGYFTISRLSKTGIDLSNWSEGMKEFGMSEIVHPGVDTRVFITLTVAVLITTLLASLYPAYKAIRLKPVEAIRKL